MPKSKEFVSDSDDSSEEEVKSKKKQKREKDSEEKAKEEKKPTKKQKTDEDNVWELGNNRQVTVRNFKGKYYVDIREMYHDKDGDLKPGKKGICLSMPQWRKFMEVVEEVDEVAKSKYCYTFEAEMLKSKEFVSDSDDSSVEEVKSKKEQKREKDSEEKVEEKKQKTDEENIFWELGNNRRVTVMYFKGIYRVDIREMYHDKDGYLKPGNKGICLSMPQWRKFMEVVVEVDEVAKSKSKRHKSKEFVSDSDDSSVEEVKSKKEQKREKDSEEKVEEKKPTEKQKMHEENIFWELGNNRKVTVMYFKSICYVDIREIYRDKDGDLKPGNKGICLSMPQWRKFMEVVEEVDEVAKSKSKKHKSKEFVSDSDDSSVEEVKSKKEQKREKDSEEKDSEKKVEEKKPTKKQKTDEENIWELGNNRQVTVRNFKGKYYVDIREMYHDKDGDLKPGKKGICLSMPQWRKFMEVVEEVDEVAKSKC